MQFSESFFDEIVKSFSLESSFHVVFETGITFSLSTFQRKVIYTI